MRVPTWPILLRTFYAFSNRTARASLYRAPSLSTRATVLKSMPTIPFLSSLFGTTSSSKRSDMTYPVQKSDDEWRAVLDKGWWLDLDSHIPYSRLTQLQSNSKSCDSRELSRQELASTTSTCPTMVSTPAPAAMRHFTKQTTSSSQAVDGQPISTAYRGPSSVIPTTLWE